MRRIIAMLPFLLLSCSDEVWSCVQRDGAMFSMSSSGAMGSADKGCSCDEMRSFERRAFGSVDEEALRSDFGCR
jgi:hypothetical protein